MAAFLLAWGAMRIVRDGKRKNKDDDNDKDGECMPKLWVSFLNIVQEIGDRSGCHQMPERSFHISGYVFPVCARCTGVAAGQFSACVTLLCGLRVSWLWSSALLLVMGLDWFVQHINIRQSTNIRRFVTGILGGFGLFNLYFDIGYILYGFIRDFFSVL